MVTPWNLGQDFVQSFEKWTYVFKFIEKIIWPMEWPGHDHWVQMSFWKMNIFSFKFIKNLYGQRNAENGLVVPQTTICGLVIPPLIEMSWCETLIDGVSHDGLFWQWAVEQEGFPSTSFFLCDSSCGTGKPGKSMVGSSQTLAIPSP